jgi:hypothetical protein
MLRDADTLDRHARADGALGCLLLLCSAVVVASAAGAWYALVLSWLAR